MELAVYFKVGDIVRISAGCENMWPTHFNPLKTYTMVAKMNNIGIYSDIGEFVLLILK